MSDTNGSNTDQNEFGSKLLDALVDARVAPSIFKPPAVPQFGVEGWEVSFQNTGTGKQGPEALVVFRFSGRDIHAKHFPLGDRAQRETFIDKCAEALKLEPVQETVLHAHLEVQLIGEFTRRLAATAVQAQNTEEELSAEQRREALERLQDPGLLYKIASLLPKVGFAGDTTPALLLYLVMTSRLLPKILSAAIKAESSAGKSFMVETVLKLMPKEAYRFLSGLSRQALIYTEWDYRHKMIVLAEAAGGETAQLNIRTLLSENRLVFDTVEKNAMTGHHEGVHKEKEGPTGLVTTTTQPSIHSENETRLITLSVDESEEQTRAIKKAMTKNHVNMGSLPELEIWQNAQRLLKPVDVDIPYGDFLVDRTPNKPLRIRRDFGKLLDLIKACALLHQHQRKEVGQGIIQANLDDYYIVKTLFEDIWFASLHEIPENSRQLMNAITAIYQKENRLVTTDDLVGHLGWKKSKISKWLGPLDDYGWIASSGHGKPSFYKPGIDPSAGCMTLPTPDEMAKEFPELAEDFKATNPLNGNILRFKTDGEACVSEADREVFQLFQGGKNKKWLGNL